MFLVIRISGVNVPVQKKLLISLTYIYGLGRSSAAKICEKAGVSSDVKLSDLSENQLSKLREVINSDYVVEGELRSRVSIDIKRKIEIKSYAGIRHIRRLPVRGQRTHTNARTRRGRSIPIAGKKKV